MSETDHVSEDELEEYCMGRIPQSRLFNIDRHLFWCGKCVDRLDATERYIKAMRKAAMRGEFEVELLAEEYRPKE
jgi:hypothetical protein